MISIKVNCHKSINNWQFISKFGIYIERPMVLDISNLPFLFYLFFNSFLFRHDDMYPIASPFTLFIPWYQQYSLQCYILFGFSAVGWFFRYLIWQCDAKDLTLVYNVSRFFEMEWGLFSDGKLVSECVFPSWCLIILNGGGWRIQFKFEYMQKVYYYIPEMSLSRGETIKIDIFSLSFHHVIGVLFFSYNIFEPKPFFFLYFSCYLYAEIFCYRWNIYFVKTNINIHIRCG